MTLKRCPKCAGRVGVARGIPYCKGCNRKPAFCECKSINAKFEEETV